MGVGRGRFELFRRRSACENVHVRFGTRSRGSGGRATWRCLVKSREKEGCK